MLNVLDALKIMMLFLLLVLVRVDSDDCQLQEHWIKNSNIRNGSLSPSASNQSEVTSSVHPHLYIGRSSNKLLSTQLLEAWLNSNIRADVYQKGSH